MSKFTKKNNQFKANVYKGTIKPENFVDTISMQFFINEDIEGTEVKGEPLLKLCQVGSDKFVTGDGFGECQIKFRELYAGYTLSFK